MKRLVEVWKRDGDCICFAVGMWCVFWVASCLITLVSIVIVDHPWLFLSFVATSVIGFLCLREFKRRVW